LVERGDRNVLSGCRQARANQAYERNGTQHHEISFLLQPDGSAPEWQPDARTHNDVELLDRDCKLIRRPELRCAFQPKLPERTPSRELRHYAEKTGRFLKAIAQLPLSKRFSLHLVISALGARHPPRRGVDGSRSLEAVAPKDAAAESMSLSHIAASAERLVYRVAGFPVALKALLGASAADPLRSVFAHRYWHPQGTLEWSELLGGLVLWPVALLVGCVWFTWRNGAAIRDRCGKSLPRQLREQLRLYFAAGVLPPWYYIFSLHDDGTRRASSFLERFETKTCYFRLLKRRKGTPLNDKSRFALFCAEHGIRCVPTIMSLTGASPRRPLPDCDLFVKPTTGRGGRGAERWDRVQPSTFRGPAGVLLSREDLLARLVERSRVCRLLIQPRLTPHRDLLPLTAGALPTLRVLTCLDARGTPDVIAAMMRTSFGSNRTVDNLHAGGIGALIELGSGTLSRASNLGADAGLGWFSAHPDTGAPIEGQVVPCWEQVKASALAAHRQFDDRVVIGWDIAVLDDGPVFIEGNGNPDLDILQRFMRVGLREHRFAALLAHHLRQRGALPARHSGFEAISR
jgi:hypothetical protein